MPDEEETQPDPDLSSCSLCRSAGKPADHPIRGCPLDCKVCQNWGHRSATCPKVICKNCNTAGHTRKRCPKLKKPLANKTTVTPTALKTATPTTTELTPTNTLPPQPSSPRVNLEVEKESPSSSLEPSTLPPEVANELSDKPKKSGRASDCKHSKERSQAIKDQDVVVKEERRGTRRPSPSDCERCSDAKVHKPCHQCPIFSVQCHEDLTKQDATSTRFVTIVCTAPKISSRAKRVKVFSLDGASSILTSRFIIAGIFEKRLFLTIDTKFLKKSSFPIKGTTIAKCQVTSLRPFKTKQEVKASLEETIRIPAGAVVDIKLRLCGRHVPRDAPQPLVTLDKVSKDVPERQDIVAVTKRANLQVSQFLSLPIKNISSCTVVLDKLPSFCIVKLFQTDEINEFVQQFHFQSNRTRSKSSSKPTEVSRTPEKRRILTVALDLFYAGSGKSKLVESRDLSLLINGEHYRYLITPTSYLRHQNSKDLVRQGYILDEDCFVTENGLKIRTHHFREILESIYAKLRENNSYRAADDDGAALIFRNTDEVEAFFTLVLRCGAADFLASWVLEASVLGGEELDYLEKLIINNPQSANYGTVAAQANTRFRNFFSQIEWKTVDFIFAIVKRDLKEDINHDEYKPGTKRKESDCVTENTQESKRFCQNDDEDVGEVEDEEDVLLQPTPRYKCSCYSLISKSGGQVTKCQDHEPYSLKATQNLTIHPQTWETVLCIVQPAQPHQPTPKCLKVFLPSDEYTSDTIALMEKPRNVYEDKIYVTIKNVSDRNVIINRGQTYAHGNELLPRGTTLSEPPVKEHVAVANKSHISKAAIFNLLPCRIIPALHTGTLIAVKNILHAFTTNGIYTVQENSQVVLKLRSTSDINQPLECDQLVAEVTSLMDHPGMCFLEKPSFDERRDDFDIKRLEALSKHKKIKDSCPPCNHVRLDTAAASVCRLCPLYHLTSVSEKWIAPGCRDFVVCALRTLDNYPGMVLSGTRANFVRLTPSRQFELLTRAALGRRAIYQSRRVARIYKAIFVCIEVCNKTSDGFTVPANFVLASAQTFDHTKQLPLGRRIRFRQMEVVHIQADSSARLKFVPLVRSDNFFMDIAVKKAIVKTSPLSIETEDQKEFDLPWGMDEGPILLRGDGSFNINIFNRSRERALCMGLKIDLHFDAHRLWEMNAPPDAASLFLNGLPSDKVDPEGGGLSPADLLDNLFELVNLNSFTVKPGQVLSVLTRAQGLPTYTKSLSVVTVAAAATKEVKDADGNGSSDSSNLSQLSILPSRQPVFLQQYVFVTFVNRTERPVNVTQRSLSVGLGFPLPFPSFVEKTRVSVVNPTDVQLKPGQRKLLVCRANPVRDIDAATVSGAGGAQPRTHLNQIVSFTSSHFSHLKIVSELETVYWNTDRVESNVTLQVENVSESELSLLAGEEICKGSPIMSEKFVEKIVNCLRK